MFSNASSLARSSVVALFALASLPAAGLAAPIGPMINPTADSSGSKPILVEMGEGRDHGPGYRIWPRVRGGNWNGGGRHWNGGGRHWNGGGNWNRGWRGGHWRGGHWGGGWGNGWGGWGPGFALGLGLGVPLGYYGGGVPLGYYGGYDGYDGYYDGYYNRPVYRPRVYRDRRYYRQYRGYNNYRRYDGEESRDHCSNAYMTGPNFFRCDR